MIIFRPSKILLMVETPSTTAFSAFSFLPAPAIRTNFLIEMLKNISFIAHTEKEQEKKLWKL
jgi:hypothetical protein